MCLHLLVWNYIGCMQTLYSYIYNKHSNRFQILSCKTTWLLNCINTNQEKNVEKELRISKKNIVMVTPPTPHTPRHTQSCPICMLRYRSVAIILFENPEQALNSRMDRWMDKQSQDSSITSAFWQGTTKKFQIRLKEQPVLSPEWRQSKTLLTIDKLDQKSLESVFLIAICQATNGNLKLCFYF